MNLIKLIIPIILFTNPLFAQNEANIWYFGGNAGLDFNSGSPVALTNGKLSSLEGCATISDSLGNLLFYSNGMTVWNSDHTVMSNGTGLIGDTSSSQSVIIVPRPGFNNMYYLFTIGEKDGNLGLYYSIVFTFGQQGGVKGAITKKNTFLIAPVTEKLTAVKHFNNKDFWVISHLWNSNGFVAYRVTSSGVGFAVFSVVGSIHGGSINNRIGYLKGSPTGDKLALAVPWDDYFELFDFDDSTGIVSNPLTFTGYHFAYGVEFSPDGKLLYGAVGESDTLDMIYQFDLCADSPSNIINSATIIGTSSDFIGALQLGSNGKIYVALYLKDYLGVIEYPNVPGTGCDYNNAGIYLNGRKSKFGLPNFVQSFFTTPQMNLRGDTTLCEGEQLILNVFYPTCQNDRVLLYDVFPDAEYLWQNGSTDSVFEVYTPGNYWVEVNIDDIILSDSIQISYIDAFQKNLREDTILCEGEKLILNVFLPSCNYDRVLIYDAFPGAEYLWQDDSKDSVYEVSSPGNYWVEVNIDDRMFVDSVRIGYKDCSFFVPNIFTPNNDGINDVFFVNGIEDEEWVLEIHNRWGRRVYQSSNYKNKWDGKGLPDGIYYYFLKDQAGLKKHKGWVQIIR